MTLNMEAHKTSAPAGSHEAGVHLSLTGRLVYPKDDRVLQFLREGWFEYRQLAMMSRLLRPGDCFVDVGAHCGLFSRIAERRLAGNGTIVIVEPNPYLHSFIGRNVGIQYALTIEPVTRFAVNLVGAAVSAATGEAVLHIGENGWTAYSTLQPKGSEQFDIAIRVPTRPLESLIAEPSTGGQVIIKLDTEGLEYDILQHALPLLRSRSDLHLMVEVDENNQALSNRTTGELISLIKDAGYQLADFDAGTGLLVPFQAEDALWGANLMATTNLEFLNSRLSSLEAEVAFETEDFLQRGAAAERIYLRSEGLKRMLEAGRRTADALAAIEATLQGRPLGNIETVQDHDKESEPSDEQRIRAVIAHMEDRSARLAGSASGIVEQLASAWTERNRLNEALFHLGRRLEDQRKTIAIARAAISGGDTKRTASAMDDGQSWDLSRIMALSDDTADEVGKLIGTARALSEHLRANKIGKQTGTSDLLPDQEAERMIKAYEQLRAEAAEAESALQPARRDLAVLIARTSLARANGEMGAVEDLTSLLQRIKENLTRAAWHLTSGQRQLGMSVSESSSVRDCNASDSRLSQLQAANRDLSAEIHRIGILLDTARKSRWLSLGKRVGAEVAQQIDQITSLITELEKRSQRDDHEARS